MLRLTERRLVWYAPRRLKLVIVCKTIHLPANNTPQVDWVGQGARGKIRG